jgi:hypothetical protein
MKERGKREGGRQGRGRERRRGKVSLPTFQTIFRPAPTCFDSYTDRTAYAILLRKSNDYNSDSKFATELLRCCRTVLLNQSRLQSTGAFTNPPTGQMCNQQLRGL